MNLKQKSFLFVVLSVTLLLSIYVGLSRYYLNDTIARYMQDRRERTEMAARSLDEFFGRGKDKLEIIANLPLLQNGLHDIAEENPGKAILPSPFLHYLVFESDVFKSGVYLVSDEGRIIWSEPPDNSIIGKEYPPFSQVKEGFRGEPSSIFTFSVWEAPNTQDDILLSTTIIDRGGSLVGYLIGSIPTNHEEIVSAFGLRANDAVHMQLVTETGLVLTSTHPDRVLRQLPYRETVLNLAKVDKSGVIEDDSAGNSKSIVAYKVLDNSPWLLASDEDEATALIEVNRWRQTLIAIGILSTIVVLGTLIFVVRGFTRPVELLTEEARRIAAGDLEGQFTSERSDEIGVLARTLEDMKLRLRSSYDALLQSEKMALMGQIVAGIAHELNNPLTIVIGHSELMMMKGIDDQHRPALTKIHDGAERASKIVKNLLTFARQRKPERKVSDLNSILSKTVDLRAYELKVSNIELVMDLSPNLPTTLCDPHQLQQVFLNLIVNAEQAIIEDNGPGIPAENLRRVFEPFFTTKTVGKGTGLGLAICQGIVAEHGGRMTVESTVGSGAMFTLELPVVNRSAEQAPPVGAQPVIKTPRPRKVLVVDDEGHMRDLFCEILRNDGHEVVTAGNGHEGLLLAQTQPFDLLITDIKMPDMDGPVLHETLKKLQSPLAAHVLFVSGDLMNPSTLRFVEGSGCPYIAKPFEVSVVRDAIRRILVA